MTMSAKTLITSYPFLPLPQPHPHTVYIPVVGNKIWKKMEYKPSAAVS